MKSRLSGHGGVANPRDTTRYRCGLRLALTRNASISLRVRTYESVYFAADHCAGVSVIIDNAWISSRILSPSAA